MQPVGLIADRGAVARFSKDMLARADATAATYHVQWPYCLHGESGAEQWCSGAVIQRCSAVVQ